MSFSLLLLLSYCVQPAAVSNRRGSVFANMASSSWTNAEDIALVEAWEEYFAQLDGPDHDRTVDALSSRLRVIRLDCETFERYYKAVEDSSQNLGEEDIKAVALINYRHEEGHEFTHVSEWETMRVWL
ncbi:hypothetical protein Hanom_Chr14g01279651 [Helianthus anomalus]